jgi:hypothetical protein
MAVWLNKWFHFSVIPFVFIMMALPFIPKGGAVPAKAAHPFHVSVIEVNHNSGDKSLEISCKIFTDDFEKVLAKNYRTKVDLINPPNKAAMDSLIKKYIFSHLSIKVNGKQVAFSYLGSENEDAATYGYIEVNNIIAVSKMDVSTNIMYDQFDDQMNIMHITVGGNRKSGKLNYPDREATFSF